MPPVPSHAAADAAADAAVCVKSMKKNLFMVRIVVGDILVVRGVFVSLAKDECSITPCYLPTGSVPRSAAVPMKKRSQRRRQGL